MAASENRPVSASKYQSPRRSSPRRPAVQPVILDPLTSQFLNEQSHVKTDVKIETESDTELQNAAVGLLMLMKNGASKDRPVIDLGGDKKRKYEVPKSPTRARPGLSPKRTKPRAGTADSFPLSDVGLAPTTIPAASSIHTDSLPNTIHQYYTKTSELASERTSYEPPVGRTEKKETMEQYYTGTGEFAAGRTADVPMNQSRKRAPSKKRRAPESVHQSSVHPSTSANPVSSSVLRIPVPFPVPSTGLHPASTNALPPFSMLHYTHSRGMVPPYLLPYNQFYPPITNASLSQPITTRNLTANRITGQMSTPSSSLSSPILPVSQYTALSRPPGIQPSLPMFTQFHQESAMLAAGLPSQTLFPDGLSLRHPLNSALSSSSSAIGNRPGSMSRTSMIPSKNEPQTSGHNDNDSSGVLPETVVAFQPRVKVVRLAQQTADGCEPVKAEVVTAVSDENLLTGESHVPSPDSITSDALNDINELSTSTTANTSLVSSTVTKTFIASKSKGSLDRIVDTLHRSKLKQPAGKPSALPPKKRAYNPQIETCVLPVELPPTNRFNVSLNSTTDHSDVASSNRRSPRRKTSKRVWSPSDTNRGRISPLQQLTPTPPETGQTQRESTPMSSIVFPCPEIVETEDIDVTVEKSVVNRDVLTRKSPKRHAEKSSRKSMGVKRKKPKEAFAKQTLKDPEFDTVVGTGSSEQYSEVQEHSTLTQNLPESSAPVVEQNVSENIEKTGIDKNKKAKKSTPSKKKKNSLQGVDVHRVKSGKPRTRLPLGANNLRSGRLTFRGDGGVPWQRNGKIVGSNRTKATRDEDMGPLKEQMETTKRNIFEYMTTASITENGFQFTPAKIKPKDTFTLLTPKQEITVEDTLHSMNATYAKLFATVNSMSAMIGKKDDAFNLNSVLATPKKYVSTSPGRSTNPSSGRNPPPVRMISSASSVGSVDTVNQTGAIVTPGASETCLTAVTEPSSIPGDSDRAVEFLRQSPDLPGQNSTDISPTSSRSLNGPVRQTTTNSSVLSSSNMAAHSRQSKLVQDTQNALAYLKQLSNKLTANPRLKFDPDLPDNFEVNIEVTQVKIEPENEETNFETDFGAGNEADGGSDIMAVGEVSAQTGNECRAIVRVKTEPIDADDAPEENRVVSELADMDLALCRLQQAELAEAACMINSQTQQDTGFIDGRAPSHNETTDDDVAGMDIEQASTVIQNVMHPANDAASLFLTPDLSRHPLQCVVCDRIFKNTIILSSHLKRHAGQHPYECDICGHKCASLGHLQVHIRMHTGEKPFDCAVCGKSFKSRTGVKYHMLSHTGEKPFACPICHKSFTRSNILHNHMLGHSGENTCHVCQKTFCNKANLDVHMRIHTDERPYQCEHCLRTFRDPSNYSKHIKLHDTDYQCGECASLFPTPTDLERHGCPVSYKCRKCGKCVDNFSLFEHHNKQHRAGTGNFVCVICGKHSALRSTHKLHMRLHTGERPFSCDECGKSFTASCHLTRHKRQHTGEKPYQCSYCSRKFARHDDLMGHIKRNHTDDCRRPYQGDVWCDACGKDLSRQKLHVCGGRRRLVRKMKEEQELADVEEDENETEEENENEAENDVENEAENDVENDAENDVENEAENDVENEAENDVENEAENDVENDGENDVENEAENDVENEAENDVENEAENDVENEAENDVENEAGNDVETEAENYVENEAANDV